MTSQKKSGMVNSPAYGEVSYVGPIGAVAGTVNTVVQGGDLTTPIGKIEFSSINLYLGLSRSVNKREDNKRKWLDEQYKQYGKHDSVSTDKNYRPGVQPESGSSNSNPGTEYRPSTDNGSVNPNQSPYANWEIIC